MLAVLGLDDPNELAPPRRCRHRPIAHLIRVQIDGVAGEGGLEVGPPGGGERYATAIGADLEAAPEMAHGHGGQDGVAVVGWFGRGSIGWLGHGGSGYP